MAERRRTPLRDQHRHSPRWELLRVIERSQPQSGFVRIVFETTSGEYFASHGFDDVVVLYFSKHAYPEKLHPEHDAELFNGREYTVRRCDGSGRRISVDFVLHDHGAAIDWLSTASIGDLLWSVPTRMCRLVPEAGFTVLFADDTARPAMERFIEESEANSHQAILFSDRGAADLEHSDSVSVVPLRTDPTEAMRHLALPSRALKEPIFFWIAGEAGWCTEFRRVLVNDYGISRDHIQFTGYWRL